MRLAAMLVVLAPLGDAGAQQRKLNAPLEFSYASSVGENYQLVPGGRIAYAGLDLDGNGHDALLCAPFGGGGPTLQLATIPGGYNDGVFYLTPTPDGSYLFSQADVAFDGKYELWRVPTDGSGPAIEFLPPFVGNEYLYFYRLSPDGQRIVYELFTQGSYHLYSALVDGSQPPVALTPGLATRGFQVTSDSSRVAFLNYPHSTLYSVPIDGSAAPTLLGAAQGLNHRVQQFEVCPDGAWVVFTTGLDYDYLRDLYSVPMDGSLAPAKLNGTLPIRGSHRISPDSSFVTYITEAEDVVSRVPIQGGPSVQLTPTVAGRAVIENWLTPDGTRMVYRANHDTVEYELFSVPVDGSQDAVEVSGDLATVAAFSQVWITPDSSRVLFSKHHGTSSSGAGSWSLYSAPLNGAAPPVRLHPALGANHSVSMIQVPQGTDRVVFGISRWSYFTAIEGQLYSVPADGSAPAVRLNSNLSPTETTSVSGFLVDPASNAVLYRADQEIHELVELYRAPLDGSAPGALCSDVREAIDVTGDVYACFPSPDGETMVFNARQEEEGPGLYAVPTHTLAEPTKLTDFSLFDGLVIGPDSRRAVFHRGSGFYQSENQIFSVPLDASAARVTLSPLPLFGTVGQYAFTPDSTRVLFTYEKHDLTGSLLYVRPADGSGPSLELTGWSQGAVQRFEIRSDSRTAVFQGGPDPDVSELYTVPLDGAHAPVRLTPPLGPGGDVSGFALSPDGAFLVYRADQDQPGVQELYSLHLGEVDDGVPGRKGRARIGGSRRLTKLNAPLVAGGDVRRFRISPDSRSVVYLADARVDEADELFRVPIDGSRAPLCLAAAGASTEDVVEFELTPDSSRVVLLGDLGTDDVVELYAVPLAGGVAPVRLSPAAVAGGDVASFELAADSARVVFLGDLATDGSLELHSAPLDGSAPALRLNPTLGPGREVYPLVQLDPEGQWVLFSADVDTDQVYDIHLVPIDGSLAPRQIHGPFLGTSSAQARGFTPDGDVFFRAPLDHPFATELYLEEL